MSSFERFQRDSRIRNSRNSSQKSSKLDNSHQKNMQQPKNIDNFILQKAPLNLIIYPKEIAFTILKGATESIPFNISLTNQSNHRLYFKIRTPSNSNDSYTIYPFQEVIQKGSTMDVSFVLSPKNQSLNKFIEDKFQIQWGMIPERPNQKLQLSHSQILRVNINSDRQQVNRFTLGKQPMQSAKAQDRMYRRTNSFSQNKQNFDGVSLKLFGGFRSQAQQEVNYNRNSQNFDVPIQSNPYRVSQEYRTGKLNQQQQQQIYKEWIQYNSKNIHQQEKKLEMQLIEMAFRGTVDKNQNPRSSGMSKQGSQIRNKKYQSLLTKTNIILVAAVSFFIGLISA